MFISIQMCGVCGAGIPTKGTKSVTGAVPFGQCYWYLYSLGTAYTCTCMPILEVNKVQMYTF